MKEVQEFIRKQNMIEAGDCVLAGVSGGADSVCLLMELLEFQETCPFVLKVVHIEHGIRGDASIADAKFVEEFCQKYEIPFQLFSFDIKKIAKERKLTVEEAGRRVRYEAFEAAAKKEENAKIAVAHNRDDQAETILMNLARGSGLKGLGGIRPVRENIIRPLLNTSRKQIEEALFARGIPWRIDVTNQELEYTRNRIRLEILPALTRHVNGQAVNHIAEAGMRLQKAEEYLQKQTGYLAEKYVKMEKGQVCLQRAGLREQEQLMQEYLIRFCLGRLVEGQKDIGQIHIEALCRLAAGENGKSLDLPGNIRAVNKNKNLVFEKKSTESTDLQKSVKELEIPGITKWGELCIKTEILPYKQQIIPEKKYTKWFDYDTISYMPVIRTRKMGDYLRIHADGGKKSLKRYLIDEKIPREEREDLPLLADGDHILWVIGYRISEGYKVTEHTKKILQIQIDKENKDGR